ARGHQLPPALRASTARSPRIPLKHPRARRFGTQGRCGAVSTCVRARSVHRRRSFRACLGEHRASRSRRGVSRLRRAYTDAASAVLSNAPSCPLDAPGDGGARGAVNPSRHERRWKRVPSNRNPRIRESEIDVPAVLLEARQEIEEDEREDASTAEESERPGLLLVGRELERAVVRAQPDEEAEDDEESHADRDGRRERALLLRFRLDHRAQEALVGPLADVEALGTGQRLRREARRQVELRVALAADELERAPDLDRRRLLRRARRDRRLARAIPSRRLAASRAATSPGLRLAR